MYQTQAQEADLTAAAEPTLGRRGQALGCCNIAPNPHQRLCWSMSVRNQVKLDSENQYSGCKTQESGLNFQELKRANRSNKHGDRTPHANPTLQPSSKPNPKNWAQTLTRTAAGFA